MHKQQSGTLPKAKVLTSRPAIEKLARRFKLPGRVFRQTIEDIFIALDTPVALSCFLLLKYGEHDQLVSKEIDPANYNCRFSFRDDFTAVSLLKKNRFLVTSFDKKERALSGFRASEEQCRLTNRRFNNLLSDPLFHGPSVHLLNALVRKISLLLGDFSAEEFFDRGAWGPGVTLSVKGKNLSASRKFREDCGISFSAYRLLRSSLELAYPLWFTEEKVKGLEIVEGNKVITVPKNAKIDRTIAVEPGINSWFQQSCGRMIRRRLSRAGFNLNSDKENQESARKGSSDSSLATVDFSAASDTISVALVREILPPRWFTLLDALRSQSYKLGEETIPYQKFSAMGNAFTFELESLIFVSAALVVTEYLELDTSRVSVFGDDIIIPNQAFPLYVDFCKFLGFTVNKEKSYSSTYFRESCGAYYFNALDVKPFFIKENVEDVQAVYRLANSIRRLAHRRNLDYGCDSRFYTVWRHLVARLPKSLRILGPLSAGDSCIHANFDECAPSRPKGQLCGYLHSGIGTRPVKDFDDHSSLLLERLWRPSGEAEQNNSVSLRGVTRIYYSRRFFASQWYDFGPWI